MKNIELNEKELVLIENFRKTEIAKEAADKELALKKEKNADLERKFAEIMDKVNKEINEHLKNAKAQIEAAVSVSEHYGIPFNSSVMLTGSCGMNSIIYTPKSFKDKWGTTDYQMLNKYNIYMYYDSQVGWEKWSASSLTC